MIDLCLLSVEGLSFAYPGQERLSLDDISLTVAKGSFVTLCGMSGSGKSTLLRHFKPSLRPAGQRTGMVRFSGTPIDQLSRREESRRIGFVMQKPENQIVTDQVWHELAFGLESLGEKTPAIRRRVAEMAAFFGISAWFRADTASLSGGQKQLLNLAAVMVTEPDILILDEPTAQLDPIAASEFLAYLDRVNRELGTTVILAEHRLEEAMPLSDQVLVMETGRIIAAGGPEEIGAQLKENRMFLSMPVPMRIHAAIDNPFPCPVTVRDGREWIDRMAAERPPVPPAERIRPGGMEVLLSAENIWFQYGEKTVLRDFSYAVCAGEIQAILGGNGAGKTTALFVMNGLESPWRGKILLAGKPVKSREEFSGIAGMLPQDPQTVFSRDTVAQELEEMTDQPAAIREMADFCELTGLLDRHPYDLSGGEQQRAALAKLLLKRPKILFLDEPTKGMDNGFKQVFGGILRRLAARGTAIVLVSHDVEFCAEYADRCSLLFDGAMVSEGPPEVFFAGNAFYTTAASRMARHQMPWAVTAADVIQAFGGRQPAAPVRSKPRPKANELNQEPPAKQKTGGRRRYIPLLLAGLAAVPLTIYAGIRFLDDRKYFWISLLIIAEIFIPFLFAYERRRPKAREIVLAAVFCGLCVAGRIGFAALPQLKPAAAIVVLAGMCFGGEMGFLVGAVSMFASDMYFGMGPWTPWQMAAMGLLGLLAGVLSQAGILPKKRWPAAVFGGVATVVIYGGIMDFQSAAMTLSEITPAGLAAVYAAGLGFNLLHGAATFLFLAIGAEPLMKKLFRIRKKYGINLSQR